MKKVKFFMLICMVMVAMFSGCDLNSESDYDDGWDFIVSSPITTSSKNITTCTSTVTETTTVSTTTAVTNLNWNLKVVPVENFMTHAIEKMAESFAYDEDGWTCFIIPSSNIVTYREEPEFWDCFTNYDSNTKGCHYKVSLKEFSQDAFVAYGYFDTQDKKMHYMYSEVTDGTFQYPGSRATRRTGQIAEYVGLEYSGHVCTLNAIYIFDPRNMRVHVVWIANTNYQNGDYASFNWPVYN